MRATGGLVASVERWQPARGECSRKIIDFYSDSGNASAVNSVVMEIPFFAIVGISWLYRGYTIVSYGWFYTSMIVSERGAVTMSMESVVKF